MEFNPIKAWATGHPGRALGGARVDTSHNSVFDGVQAEPIGHDEDRRIVLAVGDIESWVGAGRALPRGGHVVFVEFHEIDSELLGRLEPFVVISPLLCRTFDCVDLAQVLGALGYRGKYRAIDAGLPDPGLIAREVKSLVPGLDFDVARFG